MRLLIPALTSGLGIAVVVELMVHPVNKISCNSHQEFGWYMYDNGDGAST